jgi:hypothetical protein
MNEFRTKTELSKASKLLTVTHHFTTPSYFLKLSTFPLRYLLEILIYTLFDSFIDPYELDTTLCMWISYYCFEIPNPFQQKGGRRQK